MAYWASHADASTSDPFALTRHNLRGVRFLESYVHQHAGLLVTTTSIIRLKDFQHVAPSPRRATVADEKEGVVHRPLRNRNMAPGSRYVRQTEPS